MMIRARDGAELFVEVTGQGEPVLLLHSLGADHHIWAGVTERLVDRRFQVWLPDARGHGRSAKGGISLTSQVNDLEDILTACGIRSAMVAGVSMGGVEALALYQRHPRRVRCLALLDTFASLGGNGEAWVRDKEQQLRTVSMQDFGWAYAESTLRPTTPRRCREQLAQAVAEVVPEDYVAASRACFLADLESVLPDVAVPTLIMIGEHDARTPRDLSQHLATSIPGAVFHVVPEAGHLSCADNPVDVAEQLGAFFSKG